MEQPLCRIESMHVCTRLLLQDVVGRMCASSRLRLVLCYWHMQLDSRSLLQLGFSVRLSIWLLLRLDYRILSAHLCNWWYMHEFNPMSSFSWFLLLRWWHMYLICIVATITATNLIIYLFKFFSLLIIIALLIQKDFIQNFLFSKSEIKDKIDIYKHVLTYWNYFYIIVSLLIEVVYNEELFYMIIKF